jgi:hypothetical protein
MAMVMATVMVTTRMNKKSERTCSAQESRRLSSE